MYFKDDLLEDLERLNIDRQGTLLVHSSIKSIGLVQGGAETVLEVLCEYMKDGLLVMPTHCWSYINKENPRFYVEQSPSCVGILTELFRNKKDTLRTLHPTHSLAALGKEAEEFVKGNEYFDTPCARGSSYGKLFDRKATIMLLGVDLSKNTFIHAVEEWFDVPNRLTESKEQLYTVLMDSREILIPSRRHSVSGLSNNYRKADNLFLQKKVMFKGSFGDAEAKICDVVSMTELINKMLEIDINVFSNNRPLEEHFYKL